VATGRYTGRELGCRDDPDHGSGRVLVRSRGHVAAAGAASVGVRPIEANDRCALRDLVRTLG
jgi:hypothetical protein